MNSLSNMIRVAVVGGEGIGPEVTAQSHRVLNWFATRRGRPMILSEAQYGLIPSLAHGGQPVVAAPQIRSLCQPSADRRQSGAGGVGAAQGPGAAGCRLRHHPRT